MSCNGWIPVSIRSGLSINNSTLDQIVYSYCSDLCGPLAEASAKMSSSSLWMGNSLLKHFLSSIMTFMRLRALPGLVPLNRKEVLFSYIALS